MPTIAFKHKFLVYGLEDQRSSGSREAAAAFRLHWSADWTGRPRRAVFALVQFQWHVGTAFSIQSGPKQPTTIRSF